MDQVDKKQAVTSVVAMVGKAWNTLKMMFQDTGNEVVTTVKKMQPFIQEVQRLETKSAKRRRQVTYRKKKSQAKRKAWKKYGLQGRGRKK
ncbi:hypothetical protein ACQVQT_00505 [Bacillus paranthracis]|uniref:Uncharacterized protein n=2 Tax=Bacillus paranthracis TaxID=2026186 RepID=A0A7D8H8J3_9BACI|nr:MULTISPECIES: hypothetical protein [Bacillus cereus group]EJR17243.1 hypothetical protein II7_01427 [Bacillus cereus MSX-A12]KXI40973.1 hypothetical protein ACS53_12280 [Bacillus cereus]KXI58371.1 hypothetical protein ACS48_17645 [Bacillus cereus]KXI98929.1 hypothetical protein ACS49_13765 [Bacillus cereus]MCC2403241.1 hypothetical protein [Bacillus paranthracis]